MIGEKITDDGETQKIQDFLQALGMDGKAVSCIMKSVMNMGVCPLQPGHMKHMQILAQACIQKTKREIMSLILVLMRR